MSEYRSLEDISNERGESPFKVARALTRKECILYLHFGDGKGRLLCITEKMIDGYYHLYQGKKGDYPMTLKSQHECVKRLSNNYFDLSGLSFMVGEDELRLKSVDDEDRSIYVVVNSEDVTKLPPPSTNIGGATETGGFTHAKHNFEKDFNERIESGSIKPHTCFIKHEIRKNQKRGATWSKFIQLANNSVGKNEVTINGYGKIYLRRVRNNPEKEILYSHESFDHDRDKNIPDGISLIKRSAFDKAWTKIAQQKK